MNRRFPILVIACMVVAFAAAALLVRHHLGVSNAAPRVDFNRDIRPILNQNCTSCHGGVKQQAGVSFIYREEALGKGKSGRPTVVPGKPYASELIARVTSPDPQVRMPYHAPPLLPHQINLLRQWIKEGAQWEDLWAFVAPKPQVVPKVKTQTWARQTVDRFILARLEQEGLAPSAEADKTALLRRVSFDLTGLPPTPAELSAFLADPSADAYEKQVDRLLASPRYGERWASLWLDLARYADSKGFDSDLHHTVWPYRDWLINAFNRNIPYDRFMITQLAGDLLPDATLDDYIATAFHRLTPTNDEGGTDDEEFRLIAVMDRSATTWSVLNGVTMNCVQCHSHPYDPIRHREYYNSLAFFNTSRDGDFPDEAPLLRVPLDRSKFAEVLELQRRLSSLSRTIVEMGRDAAGTANWRTLPIMEASVDEALGLRRFLSDLQQGVPQRGQEFVAANTPKDYRRIRDLLIKNIRNRLMKVTPSTESGALRVQDGNLEIVGNIPEQAVIESIAQPGAGTLTALRLQVSPKEPNKARHTPEVGFIVDRVDAWVRHSDGREDKIAFRYFVPDSDSDLQTQVVRAQFVASKFKPGKPTFDAFSQAGSFSAYTKLARTHWVIAVPQTPLNLEAGSTLKVQLTQTHTISNKPATVPRLLLFSSADDHWTALAHDSTLATQLTQLLETNRRLALIPTVGLPVMAEQPDYERRETLEFERGNFLTKVGAVLSPNVPAAFPPLPQGAPRNRLTWARWFFESGQPLTARVAVNRYWEQLFGIGLVETLENFGSAGETPSHPELLDWLALHLQNDLHWDMKALLRELATSATYRQSAKTTPQLQRKDPRNRLLARGPQQRLTAEMVRDQALLASRLLSSKMGGPPVMPPQPPGIWKNVANSAKWIDATDEDRYRRALYTFLKRSAIYPTFLTFDAAAHDVSLARRIPTNTPLQALVTLNDPVYHEASQALAQHWLRDINEPAVGSQGDVLDARLTDGAWRVLSRDLRLDERAVLRSLYQEAMTMPDTPTRSPSGTLKVSTASPPRASSSNQGGTLTALTAVASVFLNLDAALTR